jgi:signal transduction histidine kinase
VLLADRSALVVPLRTAWEPRAVGALVAGAGPGRVLDEDLGRFFGQVAVHISATIAVARVQVQADRHAEIVALQDHALQTFFVISLMARAALADLPPDRVTDSVAAALVQISAVAALGTDHLREAIFALGRADVEQNGVIDALQRLVRSFQQRTGIEAELLVSGTPRRLSPELAETLHHAAAEALANVENHSRASAVVVSLHLARHTVTLSIQDDGVEPNSRILERIASSATHFGVRGVGERVRSIGGTFVAQLAHDGGFRVRVRLPLKAAPAD